MEFLALLYTVLLVTISLLLALVLYRQSKPQPKSGGEQELRAWLTKHLEAQAQETEKREAALMEQCYAAMRTMSDTLQTAVQGMSATLTTGQAAQQQAMEQRLRSLEASNAQQLDQLRSAMVESMTALQAENARKLDEIRHTVDEQLQDALQKRVSESFKAVNQQLEQVYKGLGEMQNLAADVGSLKQVLSGVKTRGILGEIQLGAILEEILAPEQYETNVATIPGSTQRVEFAVKLPGTDGNTVWLPIDSKFPGDTYAHLQDAREQGDAQAVENARHALEMVLRAEAKDIREKYVEPPYTTTFGILFLPFEGLYAEVVNAGLLETLQRDYQVNIAGPSTMAALLNSLQMGFKTLAIQKRSGEVWQLLGAVKTEFDKFGQGLSKLQQRLRQTDEELDQLIGVRSRAIRRKLSTVQMLDERSASTLLELDAEPGRPVAARLPEAETEE
ncbi:MAG: DNA recombination protein RmuC [Faecalibacterium sp.]